jgi:hypothetical protein
MKKSLFITLFLICITLFSQEKYKASDYSLPNNVKTYNTFVYRYDIDLGKYFVVEKHIRIFEKGLLTYDYVLENYLDRVSQLKKFEYNAKNQLVSIKEAEDFNDALYPYQEFYYENGRLIKAEEISGNKRVFTDYSYDNSGKITNTKTYQDDKVVLKEAEYKYTSSSDYTIYTKGFRDGKVVSEMREKYQKNLLIEKFINNSLGEHTYEFKYDEKNNRILLVDGSDNFDTSYFYGKTGAILKSKKTEYDDFVFDLVNYFEFSEITYDDGTKEGSGTFDADYVKSFNVSVLSYDFIDDLK